MSTPPPPGPHQPQGPYQPPPPYPQGPYGPPPYPQQPHPRGAHGQPPYQPWAQGYGPYGGPAPVNGLAIASLVLGILCCLPGVGLVLGLIALGRIGKRGERGRAMAVTGVVLSGAGLALWVLFFASGGPAAFWHGFKQGARDRASISLVKGECFDAPGGALSGETYGVGKVSCRGPHDAEVFASFRMEGGGYPGDASVARTADRRCYGLRDSYAMDGWALPGDVDVYYLTPTRGSWSAGDREVTCVFGSSTQGAKLTGSLRDDETVLDADQLAYLKAAHVLNAAMATVPAADSAEDDLAGHRAWAGRVSAALTQQAGMLRGHDWPTGAKRPVAAVAAGLDKARAEWAAAARSSDAEAFRAHYDEGLRLLDPAQAVTARKALGLATTPPSGGGGTGGGAGSGSGGGGAGLEV
ncbi:DUF4190 domain-containing protein [Streptomyces sp. NPDC006739]|uniref:DUF4190 domain-containing protein n=1 Tax=Streptomyces sp. NPDC006739 TaxID=3364763 RepID=UPI00367B3701